MKVAIKVVGLPYWFNTEVAGDSFEEITKEITKDGVTFKDTVWVVMQKNTKSGLEEYVKTMFVPPASIEWIGQQ